MFRRRRLPGTRNGAFTLAAAARAQVPGADVRQRLARAHTVRRLRDTAHAAHVRALLAPQHRGRRAQPAHQAAPLPHAFPAHERAAPQRDDHPPKKRHREARLAVRRAQNIPRTARRPLAETLRDRLR